MFLELDRYAAQKLQRQTTGCDFVSHFKKYISYRRVQKCFFQLKPSEIPYKIKNCNQIVGKLSYISFIVILHVD